MATEMKRVAKHIAIIYTPNGFVIQPPDADNSFQEHLSGWDSHTLEALGYEFAGGFSGLKFLRTTHGSIRFKSPKIGTLLILIVISPIDATGISRKHQIFFNQNFF